MYVGHYRFNLPKSVDFIDKFNLISYRSKSASCKENFQTFISVHTHKHYISLLLTCSLNIHAIALTAELYFVPGQRQTYIQRISAKERKKPPVRDGRLYSCLSATPIFRPAISKPSKFVRLMNPSRFICHPRLSGCAY